MSPEIWHDRVRHMIEDIDRVATFPRPVSRETFLADIEKIYAVTTAFSRLVA